MNYAFCIIFGAHCEVDFLFVWQYFLCNFAERQFCDMKLDELNELEDEIDEEDERIFEAYRLYCINCQNNTNILT